MGPYPTHAYHREDNPSGAGARQGPVAASPPSPLATRARHAFVQRLLFTEWFHHWEEIIFEICWCGWKGTELGVQGPRYSVAGPHVAVWPGPWLLPGACVLQEAGGRLLSATSTGSSVWGHLARIYMRTQCGGSLEKWRWDGHL